MGQTIILFGTLTLAAAQSVAADRPVVLWQPPAATTSRDWIWGPGGKEHAPKPPFEFMAEDLEGTNPKIKVRDAKGDHWTVKFGGEDHSEVFASRLLSATGYAAQASYFVPSGVITGAHGLKRAKPFIRKDGKFFYARFKLRDSKTAARAEGVEWSWTNNPFLGTHELSGLKILLMLMSNWDAKDSRDGRGSNTAVYTRPDAAGGQLWYAFDDWGATMGKWGGFFSRDKWNADGYSRQTPRFASTPDGQTIRWGYHGKHQKDVTSGIAIEDVRWLLTYLSAVTDENLRASLQASGATRAQVDVYTRSIRDRIAQLQSIAHAPNTLDASTGTPSAGRHP